MASVATAIVQDRACAGLLMDRGLARCSDENMPSQCTDRDDEHIRAVETARDVLNGHIVDGRTSKRRGRRSVPNIEQTSKERITMTTTPLIAVGVLRRADGTIRVGSDSDEAEVNIWLDPDVAMTLGRPDRVDPRARRQLIFFANPAHLE